MDLGSIAAEHDPQQNKGNAEKLPHLKERFIHHVTLRLFDELQEKARRKEQDEKEAAQKAGLPLAWPLFPKNEHQAKDCQIGDRLIELDRMARLGRGAIDGMSKDDGPGNGCNRSQDLLVKKVADADAAGDKARGNDQQISERDEREAGKLGGDRAAVEPNPAHHASDTAVAGQSTLPDFEHIEGTFEIEWQIVKEDMAEACSDQSAQDDIPGEAIGEIKRGLFETHGFDGRMRKLLLEEPDHEEIADDKARDKPDAVKERRDDR